MVPYEIIESVALREPFYPGRHVNLPRLTTSPFGTADHEQWTMDNWWMIDYTVWFTDKDQALALAELLRQLFSQDPNHPEIPEIVAQLKSLALDPEKRNSKERWRWASYQLPGDIGGGPKRKGQIKDYLSARYRGRVLEAMCGFNSYLADSPGREVIALDYCKEGLERYPFPDRRRICCDLNLVSTAARLEFLEDQYLDAICICFGFRYLEEPVAVFRDFRRILKSGGRLSFIENPTHGYPDLCVRPFSADTVRGMLTEAGFSKIEISNLDEPLGDASFYHVEACK